MNTLNNQSSTTSSSKGKVLVAEDNLMNQKVMLALLQKDGFAVTIVSNGKEALQALEQQPFNCLILDYQMPELDGFQTLQAIRGHIEDYIRTIPVIFLTAELNQEMLRQVEAYGISQLLPKPLDPKKLITAVALSIQQPVGQSLPDKEQLFNYLQTITDGNKDLMIDLINIFMEEAPLALEKIKQACLAGDFSTLLKTTHKIRSNFKYIGIEEVEKLLADLEEDVEQKLHPDSYMSRIEYIESITQKFLQVLSREKKLLLER